MRFFLLLGLLFILSACGVENYEDEMAITGTSKRFVLRSFDPSVRGTVQADFTVIDGAGTFTVEFEVNCNDVVTDATAVPPILAFPAPVARLTWSVEGQSVTRLVSMRNGTSISGVGEHVTVEVWDDARPYTIGGAIPPTWYQNYRVSVNIAPGVRGPAAAGPIIVPYVNHLWGMIPRQGYGYGIIGTGLDGSGTTFTATINLRDYPSANALWFGTNSGWTALPVSEIAVFGYYAGGSATGLAVDLNSRGNWIPLQSQIETITFYYNPLSAITVPTQLTVLLGVDG